MEQEFDSVRSHVHRVTAVGKVEVLLLLLLLVASTKTKVALLVDSGVGLSHVLRITLLVREVLLDDIVGLHVNLLVGVVLALVDLLHTANLLNEESVAVDLLTSVVSSGHLVHLTDLENVLKTVKSDLDDFIVRAREQITQRLDASALDEVTDLGGLLQTTASSIRDGPASLLTGLEVAVLEKVDQRRNNVGLDDGLNLCRVAGGDVRNGPARLLADAVLGGAQQGEQSPECTTVNDDLGLDVIARNDVANGSQSGCLDGCGGVHQELYETTRDASLNDSLDLVVGAIGKIGDGPASIDKDFVVERVDELGKDRESGLNLDAVSEDSMCGVAVQVTVCQSG